MSDEKFIEIVQEMVMAGTKMIIEKTGKNVEILVLI